MTWSGVLTDSTPPYYTWRLTAVATMPNPTAPGQSLTRTLSADLPLVPNVSQVPNTDAWRYVYSRSNDGDPNTCDQTIQNNPGITSSFYVSGDLCLDNSSNVYGPATPGVDPNVDVIVKGRAYLNHPSTSLGTVGRPLSTIEVDGGCKYRSNPLAHAADALHLGRQRLAELDVTGTAVTAPVADYTTWWDNASPSPNRPCQQTSGTPPNLGTAGAGPTMSGGAAGVADITPAYSYTCKQRDSNGELSWNNATKVLTVNGTVWIDAALDFSSDGVIRYSASGRSTPPVPSASGRRSCARRSTRPGPAATRPGPTRRRTCSSSSPRARARRRRRVPASRSSSRPRSRAALYAAGNMTFENNTWIQGPMVAEREVINNSMFFHFIPTFVNVPFGAPGTPIVKYNLGPVRHYVG